AGATITPRAVVKAVLKATQYFEENKQSLLAENIATNTKQQK
ncbi:MAG: electron transporter RnfG, partial [Mehylophilales bacterium 35-46-6]